jgi:hypothetical protein
MFGSKNLLVLAALLSLVCISTTAYADFVVNGDFETDTGESHVPPWIVIATGGNAAIEQGDDPSNPDNWCAAVRDAAPGGGIVRQSTVTIEAGQKYTVGFDACAYSSPGNCSVQALLYYRDGSDVAHDLASTNVTFTDGAWHNNSLNWTAQAGQDYIGRTLNVQFQSQLAGWSIVDNVVGTSIAVPEPGALTLFVVGLIGLLCYAWKKRR